MYVHRNMAPQSVRFGVQSQKLSKRWAIIGSVTKNLVIRAAPEGTLSRRFRLYLQSLAPTYPQRARVVIYGVLLKGNP
jgi:hypothetical protein